MNFIYTNPEDIKIGNVITNVSQSSIWIVLNKQPTNHGNIYRFSYMNCNGKVIVDNFEMKVKVLKNKL